MRLFRIVFLFTVLLLLGCNNLQPYANNPMAPVSFASGSDYWLGQVNATHGLHSSELQEVLLSWELEFQRHPNNSNRIKLALLLTFGDKLIRNPGKARQILNDIDTTSLSPGDRELVNIVEQHLDLIMVFNKTALREDKMQTRIHELEQKLRDLTSIERRIQQRDKAISE
jgi:hypothetical protein